MTSNNNIQLKNRINDRYSDITIVFQDKKEEISINLHRNILAWQIPYFEELFSSHDDLKEKKFTLSVDDANVAHLFILSFYGHATEWSTYQFLQINKLKALFGLDIVLDEFYQLQVQSEDFTLLLQVVQEIFWPEIQTTNEFLKILQMVKRNLPLCFDWKGVKKEFKNMILDVVSNEDGEDLDQDDGEDLDQDDGEDLAQNEISHRLDFWDPESGAVIRSYTGFPQGVVPVVLGGNLRSFEVTASKQIEIYDKTGYGRTLKNFPGHFVGEGKLDWITSIVITWNNSPSEKDLLTSVVIAYDNDHDD